MSKMNELVIKETKLISPVIEWDYESIKETVTKELKKYEGTVLTDETYADIKKFRSELNKYTKIADDFRKRIKKEVNIPVGIFETQVKEIMGLFANTSNNFDAQIKEHDEKEAQAKREAIELLITKTINDREVVMGILVQESWLLKGTTMKKIGEEIEETINDYLKAIEQINADLGVINQFVITNSSGLKVPLELEKYEDSYNNGNALSNVLTDIGTDANKQKEIETKVETATIKSVTPQLPSREKVTTETIGTKETTKITIDISGDKEKIDQALDYIDQLGLSFSKLDF